MVDGLPLPITGGADDLGLVTGILAGGAALCAACIARTIGVPIAELPAVMRRVSIVLRRETLDAACTRLVKRTAYRLG
jgi:hypothetical protein